MVSAADSLVQVRLEGQVEQGRKIGEGIDQSHPSEAVDHLVLCAGLLSREADETDDGMFFRSRCPGYVAVETDGLWSNPGGCETGIQLDDTWGFGVHLVVVAAGPLWVNIPSTAQQPPTTQHRAAITASSHRRHDLTILIPLRLTTYQRPDTSRSPTSTTSCIPRAGLAEHGFWILWTDLLRRSAAHERRSDPQ
jgi:hypothetical protein